MNLLAGIMDTNYFGTTTSCDRIGVLLLTGSLFNHFNKPNLARAWENTTKKLVFTSLQEVDYVPDETGASKALRLKAYRIT